MTCQLLLINDEATGKFFPDVHHRNYFVSHSTKVIGEIKCPASLDFKERCPGIGGYKRRIRT